MKEISGHLVQLLLGVGLTQRDHFVAQLTQLLEERMSVDQEQGEQLAQGLLDGVAELKSQLALRTAMQGIINATAAKQQAAASATAKGDDYAELSQRIDRLSEQVADLTELIKNRG